jgi:hypothetical protein
MPWSRTATRCASEAGDPEIGHLLRSGRSFVGHVLDSEIGTGLAAGALST